MLNRIFVGSLGLGYIESEKQYFKGAYGTIFASKYEIIEELGKGGKGAVYRVFDRKIEEEVALKLLKPEIAADRKTIECFKNELKFARKIAHRNVCKMYDLDEEEGRFFITMEYVPGEDLSSTDQSRRNSGPNSTSTQTFQKISSSKGFSFLWPFPSEFSFSGKILLRH
jgi:serine/threonine protein kinase